MHPAPEDTGSEEHQAGPAPAESDEPSRSIESLGTRLLTAVEARLRYRPPPAIRRLLLIGAIGVFLVGGAFSVHAVEVDPSDLRWIPLLASGIVGVPLTALGGALEYRAMASAAGRKVGLRRALRVTVLASAANLLPLPGSVLVRLKALTGGGSSLGRAAAVTGIVGFTWVAVSLAIAGGFVLAAGRPVLATGFLFGALVTASSLLLLERGRPPWTSGTLSIVGVEVVIVAVAAFRTWLVLLGLDAPATWSAAFLFPVAGSLTSAVGFLPGGMGVRELLSALLLPLAGVSASVGFLVSALHRLLGALTYAPIAAVLLLRDPGRGEG